MEKNAISRFINRNLYLAFIIGPVFLFIVILGVACSGCNGPSETPDEHYHRVLHECTSICDEARSCGYVTSGYETCHWECVQYVSFARTDVNVECINGMEFGHYADCMNCLLSQTSCDFENQTTNACASVCDAGPEDEICAVSSVVGAGI